MDQLPTGDIHLPTTYPQLLVTYLQSTCGKVTNQERLSGVAGHGAVKIQAGSQTVIVKSLPQDRERVFYEQYAPRLRMVGVDIPNLLWSGCDENGVHWMVIEYIPHVYPQNRWLNDRQQLQTLARLHMNTWGSRRPDLDSCFFQPKWDNDITDRAAVWFSDSAQKTSIRDQLRKAQLATAGIFEEKCCLSGDPNPTNWRLRQNGELVLIDWERFCCGSPAIDLAITIPGLGSEDLSTEREIAARYLACWDESGESNDSTPMPVDELAREICLAKLWTAVEFIANAQVNPNAYPEATVSFIVEKLPRMLSTF